MFFKMKIFRFVNSVVLLNFMRLIEAVNHWVLNDNGIITAKIDSPFFMREPQNLPVFLDQIKHNEIVETMFLELLRQTQLMTDELNYSEQIHMQAEEEVKCSDKFENHHDWWSHTHLTKKYFQRFVGNVKYELLAKMEEPYCDNYLESKVGICCYDHLASLGDSRRLSVVPEYELRDLGIGGEYFVSGIVAGLKKNPESWQQHTLASYYWRMEGNAHQAVECARRGVLLAPPEFKDIPLLSLGTILLRAKKLNDADILLTAAVEHAPDVAENHLALGTALALMYNFNRSLEHFEMAEKIDSSYSAKISNVKNFILCLNILNKHSEQIDSFEEYFKRQVKRLRAIKNQVTASHERLNQQQVPLGARYVDVDKSKTPLAQRGQYCSTRTLTGNDEPVLFCDFYSEMQMQLESREFDIQFLEREMTADNKAAKRRLSNELDTQMNFQNSKNKPSRD